MWVLTFLPMSLMPASQILLVSQPVRPTEQRTTGSTCQNLECVFITTCSLVRSSRTSRRTTCLSGRERAGLPYVNLARIMMNPKVTFMIWNLKTQLDFHFGGRDQPILWTSQFKNLQKFWQQPRRSETNQGQRKQLGHKDSLFLMNLSNRNPNAWQIMSIRSNMTCDSFYNNALIAMLN